MKKAYQTLIEDAQKDRASIEKKFRVWKKKKPKNLDAEFHQEHEDAFKKIDCLECANCCKTTSPIFRDIDIKRISKSFRLPEKKFIQNYLKMDGDGDYVLTQAPCPFLDETDNKCSIYDIRPLACREYPHTDRKNMYQILDLTLNNTLICPAVAQIVNTITKS